MSLQTQLWGANSCFFLINSHSLHTQHSIVTQVSTWSSAQYTCSTWPLRMVFWEVYLLLNQCCGGFSTIYGLCTWCLVIQKGNSMVYNKLCCIVHMSYVRELTMFKMPQYKFLIFLQATGVPQYLCMFYRHQERICGWCFRMNNGRVVI